MAMVFKVVPSSNVGSIPKIIKEFDVWDGKAKIIGVREEDFIKNSNGHLDKEDLVTLCNYLNFVENRLNTSINDIEELYNNKKDK